MRSGMLYLYMDWEYGARRKIERERDFVEGAALTI